ncbi:MAG: ribosome small subunit-dependent GTPase A [Azoarcus sp.]|nr:ribosome small subunit-dependent GTPase A [Azoarcus sp.]
MSHEASSGRHGDALAGRVTASYGRNYEIVVAPDTPDREVLKCVARGKRHAYACGDQVRIERTSPNQGVIVALDTRRNLLWRSDAFRQKLIAANLTQIVIVVATEPGFSPLFISRCIVAAESEGLATVIVLNKADLADRLDAARAQLAPFSKLGYPIVETNALGDLTKLTRRLAGQRSILVGQSGMGKSTITNTLIPEAQAVTAEISTVLDSGKHTTTFARLYEFEGGWIIDSPGMQAFGLAHVSTDALLEAFVEFRPHLGQCRFRDCRHDAEPGCGLRTALEADEIDPLRFIHFHTIRAEIESAERQSRGW